MMPVHYPATQWRVWLETAERSHLTVAQFCHSIGASVNIYYRFRQRLKDEPVELNQELLSEEESHANG